jgi:phage repressor protein C with HTH and peptisase S24 domain
MDEIPPEDYVLVPEVKDGKAFALRILGTSMEPKMSDGDAIVVSPNTEMRDGDIAVLRVEGEVTVKIVHFYDGRLVFLPFNTKEHTLMVFDDKTQIEMVGKVVWKVTRM